MSIENNLQGNHNIVIQSVTDSTISVTVNGATQEIQNEVAVLRELMEKMNAQQVQIADKIYNLSQLGQENLGIKKSFNVLLTKRLLTALAKNGLPPAQKFLEKTAATGTTDWETKSQFSDVAKNLISYAFVGVLGIQLRKLMAIGKEAISETKQQNYLENSYIAALKTLQIVSFALLADLWDAQKKAPQTLDAERKAVLQRFFENSIESDLQGYADLLLTLFAIFKQQGRTLYLRELQQLEAELQPGSRLYRICERIQLLKNQLDKSQHSVMTCFEMEAQLALLLEQFIFLMQYKMVSIKSVAYDEARGNPPRFLHHYIALGIDQKFNQNTEKINLIEHSVSTDSVLLYRGDGEYFKSLNLSPFVVDYNTLTLESGVKIIFYAAKNIADESLNYRFLEDNSIQNLDFKGVLKQDTNINELLMDAENCKKIKLDEVSLQFAEAQKAILGRRARARRA